MIKDMGLDNFSKMQKETLANGHRLHSAIENFFLHGSLVIPQKEHQVENIMENTSMNHLNSIAPVIENFHRPALALESQVRVDLTKYFNHKKFFRFSTLCAFFNSVEIQDIYSHFLTKIS